MDYCQYYQLYLNYKPENCNNNMLNIVLSEQRNSSICTKYFHYIIYTKVDDFNILSVAPQFYELFKMHFGETAFSIDKLNVVFKTTFKDYRIKKMYRMMINKEAFKFSKLCHLNEVIQLGESHKGIFINSLLNRGGDSKKVNKKWDSIKGQIEEGRWFAIIKNGFMVSRAYVSDIDCYGGNISVWTDSRYLRNGYAKAVTTKAISWCIDKQILPIYLVDKNNIPSIKTALSTGFEVMSEEIVITQVIKHEENNE